MLKYVFFDIGYTLVNEDRVWEARCAEQALTDEAVRLGLTTKQIYCDIVDASKNYLPQYRTVVRKYGFSEVAPYRHELERLYDNVIPVLTKLSEKYLLGVIANQTEGLRARLASLGIEKFFKVIISSWDYGVMKPDKKIFQIALNVAKCSSNEAVMVGDRLDNDIYPAKLCGMKTVWIRNGFGGMQTPKSAEYVPDYEITSLDALMDCLREND